MMARERLCGVVVAVTSWMCQRTANLSTTCPAAGSCSLLLLLAPFPGPTLFSPTLQLVPWCLSLSPCGRCPLSFLSLLLFAHPTAGSGSVSLESSKAPYPGSLPPFPSPLLSIHLTSLLEKSLSSKSTLKRKGGSQNLSSWWLLLFCWLFPEPRLCYAASHHRRMSPAFVTVQMPTCFSRESVLLAYVSVWLDWLVLEDKLTLDSKWMQK